MQARVIRASRAGKSGGIGGLSNIGNSTGGQEVDYYYHPYGMSKLQRFLQQKSRASSQAGIVDMLSSREKGPGYSGLHLCPVKGCTEMFDDMAERADHLRSHRIPHT